jgi:nucleoside-diphosphate-sugar epimerase
VTDHPRFLVTGATGFIGRRVVRRLVADVGPTSVVCLTKAPATALEAKAVDSYRPMGVRVIDGNLLDEPVSAEAAPPVDVVLHLAANIDTDAPEDALRVNHEGTRHLLDWLRPISRGVRVVYASSVAVHDRDHHPNAPISENSPFVPRTAYGRTKLEGERIISTRAATDGYTWTTLRLPTVYGPGQKPDGLFDKLIAMASKGALMGRIDWPGRTSIMHVDDVAAAMIEMAQRGEAAGEVYCLASDESPTIGELARRIGDFVGRPVDPIEIPPPLLAVLRTIVWNRAIQAAIPSAARLPFWRLSLIVSDGFWFDTTKFRSVYQTPLKSLEEGLVDTVSTRPV